MSEKQKRKTKATPKLPWDLESEILSRVPHTSVKRLQLTCKRWYALFKDPRFIKKHLDKATTQMVLKQDDSVYSFSFDFHGIHTRYDQFITITGKLSSLKDSEAVEISRIFHCEGLLLCTTKDNRLVVWNPCTGQTRWIQSRLPSNGYAMYDKYFLGYGNTNKSCDDKSCDSFKILRFAYYYHQRCKLEMYEFNSDSWRAFHDVNCGTLSSLGVSLKGNTYWLGSDDDVDSKGNTYCLDSDDDDDDLFNLILRFDFTTERFESLSLPFPSDLDEVKSRWVLSVVREEKLALLVENSNHYGLTEMTIWMTNTTADEAKDLSWSVFLVLDFTMTTVISFLVDEDNKRVMCCHQEYVDEQERTIVYVAGEDIYKPVYSEFRKNHYDMKRRRPSPLLLSYVPSLVQIPAKQGNENGD